MTAHPIGGLHHLARLDPARILVIGKDVAPETWAALQAVLPRARHVSLGGPAPDGVRIVPRAAPAALPSLLGLAADAVVVVPPYRGLEILACALPAGLRLALAGGRLVPVEPWRVGLRELALLDDRVTGGRAARGARRLRRELLAMAFGDATGAGNDYTHLTEAVAELTPRWPRRRASVILPVYNRRAILEKTLTALLHQTYPRELFEVIIADDGSSDGPEALVAAFEGELDVRVVRQQDLGFRAARVRNLGMAEARGEVIVLLDCDMLPAPGHLQAMLRWFHVTEDPLVVIGDRSFVDTTYVSAQDIRHDPARVAGLPATLAPRAIRRPEAPTEDWRRHHYRRYRGLRDHSAPYQFAASGNLALWRAEAEAAGGFDEAYTRWGGEDTEFAYRLYRRGAYFVPELEAVAYHQDHPDAVVREQDAAHTRALSEARVPHRRRPRPGARPLVPKTAILCDDPRGLAAALAQTDDDLEVLHVGPAEVDDPRVRVLPEGSGVPEATEASRAEYLLLVPAGARLRPDALERMLGPIEADPAVVIVAGAVQVSKGDVRALPLTASPHLMHVRDAFRAVRAGRSPTELLPTRGVVRRLDAPVADAEEDLEPSPDQPRRKDMLEVAQQDGLRGALRRWLSDAD